MFSRIGESARDTLVNNDIEIVETVENEICLADTSVNTEFKQMIRGQSFENERGCDFIMQQFMHGLESFIEPPSFSYDAEEALQTKWLKLFNI